jgi:2-amino-4-hydroxy-6-hydroxymethyldihydropteridine diphosphokinase
VTGVARAFIAVGSNIDPEQNVRRALSLLAQRVRVVRVSTVYRTAALERPGDPSFYNCVVEVGTEIAPHDLKHEVLRRIETELGRRRTADSFAPRTIDLDLLLYGDAVAGADDLALPDPDIEKRPFLAIPLRELAPALRLPGSGRRIDDIAAAFEHHGMQPLPDFTTLLRRDIAHGYKDC